MKLNVSQMLGGVVLIYVLGASASTLLRAKRKIAVGLSVPVSAVSSAVQVLHSDYNNLMAEQPFQMSLPQSFTADSNNHALAMSARHPALAKQVDRYIRGMKADGLNNAVKLVTGSLSNWLSIGTPILGPSAVGGAAIANNDTARMVSPALRSFTLTESVVDQLPEQQHPLLALGARQNRSIKVVL